MKSYSVAGSVLGWIVFQKQNAVALHAIAMVSFRIIQRYFLAFRSELLVYCMT